MHSIGRATPRRKQLWAAITGGDGLDIDGWMVGWIEGWMAGWMDGWMDGWIHNESATANTWGDG